ncbi:MAG: hypothetical protein KatS3mg019_1546 [Fimbriimonadales bacterium]|nr:MAG: hypothetical protein KatS3mg019_1546 [Fimbriimonadales bacterium]
MIRAFVDRIELTERGEPLAVLLIRLGEGDYLQWLCPVEWLPEGVREGDWLQVEFQPDAETQQAVGDEVEALLRELGSNDPA